MEGLDRNAIVTKVSFWMDIVGLVDLLESVETSS